MSYLELYKKHKIYKTTMEYFENKYEEREDKDNIWGVGITEREFVYFIIDELLGADWYVVDPLGQSQIYEIAFLEILNKYSPKKKEN